jgi:hypothetical protein
MKPETHEVSAATSLNAAFRREVNDPLHIVVIYAIVAGLWVLLSDKAVDMLFSDPVLVYLASTLKGWFFVVVTSILLYALIRSRLGEKAAVLPVPPGLPHSDDMT